MDFSREQGGGTVFEGLPFVAVCFDIFVDVKIVDYVQTPLSRNVPFKGFTENCDSVKHPTSFALSLKHDWRAEVCEVCGRRKLNKSSH